MYRVVGRRVGIKLHEKTLAKHKDDLLRLVYFGMTMAAVGGIAIRIEEGVVNHETGLPFVPLTLAYCVFYTFIFELVKERDITLSVGLFENKIGMIVVAVGMLTGTFVVVSMFLTAWQVSSSFFLMYCGVAGAGSIAHVIMFCPTIPGVPGRSYLHLHHWYWSVPLAHMCVFHTDVSMLAQAMLLAIHIHGVDCFGVEPLFYDTERRARHPSDFDWVLKEHAHEKRPYDLYIPNDELANSFDNLPSLAQNSKGGLVGPGLLLSSGSVSGGGGGGSGNTSGGASNSIADGSGNNNNNNQIGRRIVDVLAGLESHKDQHLANNDDDLENSKLLVINKSPSDLL